ncbi:MAG: SUMF1/EgtB/PvdO family nonheme iron enzyme [Acidobacteriota bacterium]|nr:SUMF1/EgtB/PvdO family nonheme iron enzyme [Acidobacteriota bacterium]
MDSPPHFVVDRDETIARFQNTRARTSELLELLVPDAYYEQPIPLRHPVLFYEGHIPAFSVNTLIKRGLGRPGVDEGLEVLFARGIDPEDQSAANGAAIQSWPTRETVQRYVDKADRTILDALEHAEIERNGHPVLHRGQAVFTLIEHEELHQETLAYMWHRLPMSLKRRPTSSRLVTEGAVPGADRVRIPAGRATLGADLDEIPFGWDNEFPRFGVDVPAFAIDRHNVTNQAFLEFVEDGGYHESRWWADADWVWRESARVEHPPFWDSRDGGWCWRGMFEWIPLPASWPVYVTHAEASAYTRWAGCRLPTEAEFHRAAFGTPDGRERPYPWGDEPPDHTRGAFDFSGWEPMPVGSFPAGASAWRVHDLVGNGWEWTSTVFEGFPGFAPMASYPEYSADFFDGLHYVIKGASPSTAAGLVRRSLRNWFRPHYPFVYAGFRCVE